jgi:hypothetical protein
MKTVISIVLLVGILLLGFFVWDSIQQPIRFGVEYNTRKDKVVDRLMAIRDAQVAYKSVYQRYTSSFDTLIDFVKNGQLPLVKMEGRLTDSMLAAGMTEVDALAKGIIKRDTIRISVADSLVKGRYVVDSISIVPFGNGAKFEMGAGFVTTASNMKIQVFEAKVPYDVFLKGLDEQEVVNLNAVAYKLERYQGLKVGSLEEANNNAGNWE